MRLIRLARSGLVRGTKRCKANKPTRMLEAGGLTKVPLMLLLCCAVVGFGE